MFNAYASSKNSGSLSRQVGASIMNNEGKIVSSGTNDLPKVRGGIFATKLFERRIFNYEIDPSDTRKKNLLVDMMHILNNLKLLNRKYKINEIQQLLEKYQTELKRAQITNIIEFFREIHAEMDAIISAARSNNSTINCSLFTTTYPCHDCTKHIISAGIMRVIFVEPYPKSLATELYDEFISIEGVSNPDKKVRFESYVGVAPRLFMNIFTMSKRKESDGRIVKWDGSVAKLKQSEQFQYYYLREIVAIGKISKYIPIDLQ
jgi:cytidine deaminase